MQWTTTGPAGAYVVLLSQDNGASFTNVSGPTDLPGTARSFSIALPTPTTASVPAKVRVEAKDANGTRLTTVDSPTFTLQQQPLSVQVTQPALPQTLEGRATLPIAWVVTGMPTTQRLQFVFDNNGEVKPIETGLGGGVRSFTWMIPADSCPWASNAAGGFGSWSGTTRRAWRGRTTAMASSPCAGKPPCY